LQQLHIIIFQERICEKIDSCRKRKGFRLDLRGKGSKIIFGVENIKIWCKYIQAKEVSSQLPKPEAWHGTCHQRHGRARYFDSILLLFPEWWHGPCFQWHIRVMFPAAFLVIYLT